jgi:hypothetical protein
VQSADVFRSIRNIAKKADDLAASPDQNVRNAYDRKGTGCSFECAGHGVENIKTMRRCDKIGLKGDGGPEKDESSERTQKRSVTSIFFVLMARASALLRPRLAPPPSPDGLGDR